MPKGDVRGVWELLEGEAISFKELAELIFGEYTAKTAWALYAVLLDRAKNGGSLSSSALTQSLSTDEISLLTKIAGEPVSLENSGQALGDYIKNIRSRVNAGANETDLMEFLNQKRLSQSKGYGG
jgi:hypothetical protein